MKIISVLRLASASFFLAISSVALAQNVGTVTLNAVPSGLGAGKQGFRSIGPCTNLYSITWQAGVPSCGQINLASAVTGTLPVANGGTGTTTVLAALQAWGLEIPNLTHKTVPVGADKIGFYDVAGAAYKYSTLTEMLSAVVSGISSIDTATGAITISGLLTRSSQDLTVTAATKANQQTGTSTTTVVTPAQQQSHGSALKAAITFLGNGTAQGTPFNASSSRLGAGSYRVTFSTAFSSTTSYGCTITTDASAGTGLFGFYSGRTTTTIDFTTLGSSFTALDVTSATVLCVGTQ